MARQRCREHFAEAEIWYMAYSLLNALRQFEPFCEPAGEISLQRVVMNHKGEVRLKTSLTAPFESCYDEPKSYYCKSGGIQLPRSCRSCSECTEGWDP